MPHSYTVISLDHDIASKVEYKIDQDQNGTNLVNNLHSYMIYILKYK